MQPSGYCQTSSRRSFAGAWRPLQISRPARQLVSFAAQITGPSIVDRVVAVDGLVVIAIGAIAADAVRQGDARFADAAILLAIIAFVGTGIVARFIERRGG